MRHRCSRPLQGGALQCVPWNNAVEPGIVTRVIDGDTIVVFVDGQLVTVRYIGIDAPETVYPGTGVEYFGPEAREKNRQLVEGKAVFMVKDVSETDQYNRLLRYVMVGNLYGRVCELRAGAAGVRERLDLPAGCGLRGELPGCSTPGCGRGERACGGRGADADVTPTHGEPPSGAAGRPAIRPTRRCASRRCRRI